MPKLQFGEDSYRIVADDGTEGELALYGDPAELVIEGLAGHRYVAVCDEGDGGEVVSLLPDQAWIVDGKDVAGVTLEDVDFREPEAGKPEGTIVVEEEDDEEDDDDFVSEPGEEDDEDDDEDEFDDEPQGSGTRTKTVAR